MPLLSTSFSASSRVSRIGDEDGFIPARLNLVVTACDRTSKQQRLSGRHGVHSCELLNSLRRANTSLT